MTPARNRLPARRGVGASPARRRWGAAESEASQRPFPSHVAYLCPDGRPGIPCVLACSRDECGFRRGVPSSALSLGSLGGRQ